MVQISNELATMGLCEPLIPSNNTSSERELTRMFLYRLENAVKNLRKAYPTATLTLLVDAADNAEMAAKEFNQSCFAHELLREKCLMDVSSFICADPSELTFWSRKVLLNYWS